MNVQFHRLRDDDLPLLHRWLNEPGVVRWWEGDDVSWEAVVRDYGSMSSDSAEYWLASVEEEAPFGWIQCFAAADYAGEPEFEQWWALGIDRTAAGIDYLIGDPDGRGQGRGAEMIRAFVERIVFARHPEWTQVCASPLEANVASWRALEKAGFRFVGTFPSPHGPCRLMAADRAAAGAPG